MVKYHLFSQLIAQVFTFLIGRKSITSLSVVGFPTFPSLGVAKKIPGHRRWMWGTESAGLQTPQMRILVVCSHCSCTGCLSISLLKIVLETTPRKLLLPCCLESASVQIALPEPCPWPLRADWPRSAGSGLIPIPVPQRHRTITCLPIIHPGDQEFFLLNPQISQFH